MPLAPRMSLALADLLWRMEKREEAWQLNYKLASQDPSQSGAWAALDQWSQVLQREGELVTLGRQLTQQRPHEARSWMTLAGLLPDHELAEKLEAYAQALKLNPHLADAYDQRAELLARYGKLDEATRSILHGAWKDVANLPHSLRGRLAWITSLTGDTLEAMREMRGVLSQNKEYYWGWEQMCYWAEKRSDHKARREATVEMIRLAPNHPAPHCEAGDAELAAEQPKQAIIHYRRGLTVDPSSPRAGWGALQVLWKQREFTEVRSVCDRLPQTGTCGIIRRIYLTLLAGHEKDMPAFTAGLHSLAQEQNSMGGMVKTVQDFFQAQPNLQATLDSVLEDCAKDGSLGGGMAVLWMERICERQQWHRWPDLGQLMGKIGSRAHGAACTYFDSIGDAKAALPHVPNFIEKHRALLESNGVIWGKVGYSLTASGGNQQTIDWLEPRYKRADAEGWMLQNLGLTFQLVGQEAKALEVHRYVIDQRIMDNSWNYHVGSAALFGAFLGDWESCRKAMDQEQNAQAKPREEFEFLTGSAIYEVQFASDRSAAKKRLRSYLPFAKSYLKNHGLDHMAQTYERAVSMMKAKSGAWIMPWERWRPTGQKGGCLSKLFPAFLVLHILVMVVTGITRQINKTTKLVPGPPPTQLPKVNWGEDKPPAKPKPKPAEPKVQLPDKPLLVPPTLDLSPLNQPIRPGQLPPPTFEPGIFPPPEGR
jgi:cellulose synthase operon protein C